MAVAVSIGVIFVISNLSNTQSYESSSSSFSSSSPDLWNDALFHQWETFLNDNVQSLEMKSFAKKQARKQERMKRKQFKKASKGHTFDDLMYLNTSHAFRLLRHDSFDSAAHFFHYQQGWEAQINQAYCAVATSAAVLNSYRGIIQLPTDPAYEPYPWATQNTIVNDECVKSAVYDVDSVRRAGLGLGMVPGLLNCFLQSQGYTAVPYPVDPETTDMDEMKQIVVNALLDDDSRVILNYDRGGIGQGPMGHGHWSPIGAYSADIDAFLIMDVAKYKYPPVFVPSDDLMNGVSTLDMCEMMSQHTIPVDWTKDYATIGKELGCKPGYRGFVVIKPIDVFSS